MASTTNAVRRMCREGEVRDSSGTTPTNYTYAGQYSYTNDFSLMFYREAPRRRLPRSTRRRSPKGMGEGRRSGVGNARWYDPSLGRFAQADTIIPGAGNPRDVQNAGRVFI